MKFKINWVEKEVLIEGNVPTQAIKSHTSMNITKGLQAIQIGGIILTCYDLGIATVKSVEQESIKPITAESIRQIGGWSAALAGVTIGGQLGTAVGIETGPGAILTGTLGALTFGAAGYLGADWLADFIDEN
ncbi:MAG: hypothetical protein SVR94_11370 [Pseudomonadota bacterium]|nr:hypothetical protein [Pseudomonadota bacterium]